MTLNRTRLAALAAALLMTGPAGCGAASESSSGPGTSGLRATSQLPPGLVGRAAPAFALADARGGKLASRQLAGRPYVVTFLYTTCPDVCPLIGEEIRQALSDMHASARRVAVVGVSVDPRHDSAAAVRQWLARHHEPANFHYLIGSESNLKPLWKGYFAAPQIPGDPRSSHTAAVWLIDRDGRLAAKFDAGAVFNPADLAYDLNTLLRR